MSFIKKILEKIKAVFSLKKDSVKQIEEPKNEIKIKNDFKESIKVGKLEVHKNNIEVPVFEGNGLGISDTISLKKE